VYNIILPISVAIFVISSRLCDVLASGPKCEMRTHVTNVHHFFFYRANECDSH